MTSQASALSIGTAVSTTVRYAGIGDEAGPALADQIGAIARLGWRSIELRTSGGMAMADLGDRAFGRLADAIAAAGLDVVCVDSRIGGWSRSVTSPFEDDSGELAVLARRCARLGARYIRIMSYPNDGLDDAEWGRRALGRLRSLARQAQQHAVVLLHENCSGWAATSAERMLELAGHAGPSVALLFDTGNGVPYGYDSYALLAQIIHHVAHVHVKDATGGPGRTVYTMPGEGDARVADCLRALVRHGYPGSWSIEPHLAARPHEQGLGEGGDLETFVAYGHRLERLVREEVLTQGPAVA